MRRVKPALWAILLLLVVPILFFHESLFTDKVLSQADVLFALHPWDVLAPPDFLPSNLLLLDQTQQFFPWLSFARDQMRKGEVPLWNPYNYSGSPLLANGQSAVLSPFHLLFYIFPFLKMFAVSACLRLFLAALFMYLFLRALHVGRSGAMLSALGYQTCGFLVILLNHPHSTPAAFLPLLFWLTERLLQKPSPRRAAFLSIAFGLHLLSGHVMTALLQTLVLLCYGLYRSKRIRWTIRFFFSVFLGLLASALVLLPTIEYAMLSHARTYRFAQETYHFIRGEDLKAILTQFFPWLYGIPLRPYWVTHSRNFNMFNQGFVGLTVLAFALGAVFGKRKGKPVWFFVLLTLIAFGAAYHLPLFVTLLHVSGMLGLFRPTSWLLFSAFSLSVLAGIGFDQILLIGKTPPFFKKVLLILTGWVGACGLGVVATQHTLFPEVPWPWFRISFVFAMGILGSLLMSYLTWSRGFLGSRFWKAGVFSLVMVEHFLFGFWYNPTVKPEDIFPKTPAIEFLHSDEDPNPFRYLSVENVLLPNFGMMYRLQDIRGYDAVDYDPYIRYLEKVGPLQITPSFGPFCKLFSFPYYDSPLVDLLNVKYVLSYNRLKGDAFPLVYNGEIKIHRNPRAFPRATLFTDYELIPDPEEQLNRLVQKEFDIRRTVLLKDTPPLDGKRATRWRAEWVRYEPNRFTLDVTSNGSGILFLSEVDYPGWKAYIDGQRTKILRANFLFRSIVLPSGTHRVEMRYDPDSFKWGLWISGVTLLILVLLIFFP